jgi:BirA family biotin operon repressor/biotin-[acetyl-CoA-carboxylase] ligase
METIDIANPFPGAGCFFVDEAVSTMDEARRLARLGFPPGTLVAAEFQTEGRGRFPDRRWESEKGKNLLFTIRLEAGAASLPGLPLRAGSALCRAALEYSIRAGRAFARRPALKWPNDLVFDGSKAAGLLCEARAAEDSADGVYVGVGVNCNQTSFPGSLASSSTSLALELGSEIARWELLETFLRHLVFTLSVQDLLWRRGEKVTFLPGLPGVAVPVEGRLQGIDPSGALLIERPEGLEAYPAGELTADAPSYKV